MKIIIAWYDATIEKTVIETAIISPQSDNERHSIVADMLAVEISESTANTMSKSHDCLDLR